MGSEKARTFAQRLDYLFREVHPPSRGPYTYTEVAQAIGQAAVDGERGITASAIRQLRTGIKQNPTMRTIKALADFFGVPPSYFFDDETAERTEAELELLTAMRNHGVRQLALRAAGLSPSTLQMLVAVVERTRQLEGLSDEQFT